MQYRLLLVLLLAAYATAPVPIQPTLDTKEWMCSTNSSNIDYSVERCNKTNKLILKVKISDEYVLNITQPTTPAPVVVEDTTVTTRRYPYVIQYEDYSYEYLDSLERKEHLTIPLQGHEMTEPAPLSASIAESDEEPRLSEPEHNEQFCRAAAEEEDSTPVQMLDGEIHPKFEEVPGFGFYRFHTKPRKWEEARRICEQEGAHLVIINSEQEAQALLKIHARCPNILSTHFNSYSYVGVHDIYNDGHFETVYGEPLEQTGYVNWAFNQPDNAHHFGEDCVSMNRRGFFNDVPCSTELPYFCEHN